MTHTHLQRMIHGHIYNGHQIILKISLSDVFGVNNKYLFLETILFELNKTTL